MTTSNQAGAAVVGTVVAAGLQTRAFAIPPGPATARDAAIAHLTNRVRTAVKGKPHA